MKTERNHEKLLNNYIDSAYLLSKEIEYKLSYFLSFPSIEVSNYKAIKNELDTRVQFYNIVHYFKSSLNTISKNLFSESDVFIKKFCSKYSIDFDFKNTNYCEYKRVSEKNSEVISDNIKNQQLENIDMDFNEEKFNNFLIQIKKMITEYEQLAVVFAKNLNKEDYDFPFMIKNPLYLLIKKTLRDFNFISLVELKEHINHKKFLLDGNYISMSDFVSGDKKLFKYNLNQ